MEASALSAPAGLGRLSLTGPLLRLRSDEQLVALFRAGSEQAFDVIHDRYRQRLFAYTRQMLGGSRQDAEDALQDVFLRAYAALRADARPVSLRAWLYRVAHNRCIDQIRRPAPRHSDVYDLSRGPLHDPLAEAQRREDLRRLVADVGRLPHAQRSALLMREMEGLTYEELAAALDTTIPAIKSLLLRARIGLTEAAEARDAPCGEIRAQLAAACDRGVRASGHARRHLRECPPCRAYRSQLRGVRRSLAALAPAGAGPLGLLAQLFGAGGSGAGAAAAGAGAGGGTIVAGGAGVATAGKVAAIVVSVAVVTAGAEQATTRAPARHRAPPAPAATAIPRSAPVERVPRLADRLAPAAPPPAAARPEVVASAGLPAAPAGAPATAPADATGPATRLVPVDVTATGGALAPDEIPVVASDPVAGADGTPAGATKTADASAGPPAASSTGTTGAQTDATAAATGSAPPTSTTSTAP